MARLQLRGSSKIYQDRSALEIPEARGTGLGPVELIRRDGPRCRTLRRQSAAETASALDLKELSDGSRVQGSLTGRIGLRDGFGREDNGPAAQAPEDVAHGVRV